MAATVIPFPLRAVNVNFDPTPPTPANAMRGNVFSIAQARVNRATPKHLRAGVL